MDLKPCFICGGKTELFKEGGEYAVRCTAVPPCNLVLDHLGTVKRNAVRGYNAVHDAPYGP